MSSLYQLLAIGTALALGATAVTFALRALRETEHGGGSSGEDAVPMAPLQRLGVAALAAATVPAAATLWVLLYAGLEGYATREAVRLLVVLLGVFALVAGAGPVVLAQRRAARGTLLVDERDRQVLATAPVVQMWFVLALVVVWCIALTERYWDAGVVPVGAIAVLCWTTIIGWAVSLPMGIVLGYRMRAA